MDDCPLAFIPILSLRQKLRSAFEHIQKIEEHHEAALRIPVLEKEMAENRLQQVMPQLEKAVEQVTWFLSCVFFASFPRTCMSVGFAVAWFLEN